MEFQITRTSDYLHEKPPCNKAKESSEIDEWGDKVYTIEINTLEELIDLIDTEGSLVLYRKVSDNQPLYSIELYDDFRE